MKLIYVMDALCGWCHGNVKSISQAYDKYRDKIRFEALPGGMWCGDYATVSNSQIVDMIRSHDKDVAARTGAKFPPTYQKNILDNPKHVFNSEPPSRAIVAFNQLNPDSGFLFSEDIIEMQFTEGKDLNDIENYLDKVEKYGISGELFKKTFASEKLVKDTQDVFSRVQRLGVTGFPTLIVEKQGRTQKLVVGYAPFEYLDQKIQGILE